MRSAAFFLAIPLAEAMPLDSKSWPPHPNGTHLVGAAPENVTMPGQPPAGNWSSTRFRPTSQQPAAHELKTAAEKSESEDNWCEPVTDEAPLEETKPSKAAKVSVPVDTPLNLQPPPESTDEMDTPTNAILEPDEDGVPSFNNPTDEKEPPKTAAIPEDDLTPFINPQDDAESPEAEHPPAGGDVLLDTHQSVDIFSDKTMPRPTNKDAAKDEGPSSLDSPSDEMQSLDAAIPEVAKFHVSPHKPLIPDNSSSEKTASSEPSNDKVANVHTSVDAPPFLNKSSEVTKPSETADDVSVEMPLSPNNSSDKATLPEASNGNISSGTLPPPESPLEETKAPENTSKSATDFETEASKTTSEATSETTTGIESEPPAATSGTKWEPPSAAEREAVYQSSIDVANKINEACKGFIDVKTCGKIFTSCIDKHAYNPDHGRLRECLLD